MTSPTALGGIRAGIRCTVAQPISAGQGSAARPEVARSEKNENARKLGRGRIGMFGGNSQGLHYYADQHIQWPNSSSPHCKELWRICSTVPQTDAMALTISGALCSYWRTR